MAVAQLVGNRLSALVGAVLFAGAGATMGSMNAGWSGLERNANALFPLLGVGSGLVVIGFVRSDLKRELYRAGGFGRAVFSRASSWVVSASNLPRSSMLTAVTSVLPVFVS